MEILLLWEFVVFASHTCFSLLCGIIENMYPKVID